MVKRLNQEEVFNVIYELDKFEHLVFNKEYEKAYQQLLRMLQATSVHRKKADKLFGGLTREQRDYVATRFVSAAFQLFLDKAFNLNVSGYEALSTYGRNFAIILSLTPYKNADHVIRHLVGQTEVATSKDTMNIYDFRKLLFLWSIYSDVQLPLDRFCREHPDLMKYVMFNALTFNCYVDPCVSGRRDNLLNLLAGDDFDLKLDNKTISFAGPLWMYTTYSDNPDKHYAKDKINRAYRNWALNHGLKEPDLPSTRKIVDKPKMVVVVEQMTKNHAVYRCYGKALKSIRKRFHTVGMAFKEYVDDEAMDVFDEQVYFKPDIVNDIKKNVGKIIKQKPDVILYLSLGMQNSTIPMATLRLAPIQMLFPAHPATSRIETIDYLINEEGGQPSKRNDLSEKLILLPKGSFSYTDQSGFMHIKVQKNHVTREGKKIIKVAIPAFSMKIGSQVIDALQKIKEKAESEVEFHFFPHLNENSYIQFQDAIEKRLPNSVVHLPYTYKNYLSRVGECDLYLSTFPFCNYNGTVDSIKVNLPVLALDSGGLEGAGEVVLLRQLGFPEWVISKTREEYIETAVELIDNEKKRQQLSEFCASVDVGKVFDDLNHAVDKTGDALYQLYLVHDRVQEMDKKVIHLDELNNLTASLEEAASNG